MARVTRRPLAETDILEIWDYIAEGSIVEADRWVDRLDEKLALWATQPMMGRGREVDSHRCFGCGRQAPG
jgi:toxin ParE1/3/4